MKKPEPKIGKIFYEKSRPHSATRQMQQMPNGRSKHSSKERKTQWSL